MENISLKEYVDLKIKHLEDLRIADQKAVALALDTNKERLDHLNENAKRTIEERTHFVSKEAFEPFRDNVNKILNQTDGKVAGLSIGWKVLISVLGLVVALLSIINGVSFLLK